MERGNGTSLRSSAHSSENEVPCFDFMSSNSSSGYPNSDDRVKEASRSGVTVYDSATSIALPAESLLESLDLQAKQALSTLGTTNHDWKASRAILDDRYNEFEGDAEKGIPAGTIAFEFFTIVRGDGKMLTVHGGTEPSLTIESLADVSVNHRQWWMLVCAPGSGYKLATMCKDSIERRFFKIEAGKVEWVAAAEDATTVKFDIGYIMTDAALAILEMFTEWKEIPTFTEARRKVQALTLPEEPAQGSCICGHAFLVDDVFCPNCGQRRKYDNTSCDDLRHSYTSAQKPKQLATASEPMSHAHVDAYEVRALSQLENQASVPAATDLNGSFVGASTNARSPPFIFRLDSDGSDDAAHALQVAHRSSEDDSSLKRALCMDELAIDEGKLVVASLSPEDEIAPATHSEALSAKERCAADTENDSLESGDAIFLPTVLDISHALESITECPSQEGCCSDTQPGHSTSNFTSMEESCLSGDLVDSQHDGDRTLDLATKCERPHADERSTEGVPDSSKETVDCSDAQDSRAQEIAPTKDSNIADRSITCDCNSFTVSERTQTLSYEPARPTNTEASEECIIDKLELPDLTYVPPVNGAKENVSRLEASEKSFQDPSREEAIAAAVNGIAKAIENSPLKKLMGDEVNYFECDETRLSEGAEEIGVDEMETEEHFADHGDEKDDQEPDQSQPMLAMVKLAEVQEKPRHSAGEHASDCTKGDQADDPATREETSESNSQEKQSKERKRHIFEAESTMRDTLDWLFALPDHVQARMEMGERFTVSMFNPALSAKPEVQTRNTFLATIQSGSVEIVDLLLQEGLRPALLNFARDYNCGGGFDQVLGSQDADIFRKTSVFLSLKRGEWIRDYNEELPAKGSFHEDAECVGIYSPYVVVVRSTSTRESPLHQASASGDSELPSFGAISIKAQNMSEDLPSRPDLLEEKVRVTLWMAASKGHDSIVLGFGYFQNHCDVFAETFMKLLSPGGEFENVFSVVVFGIGSGVVGDDVKPFVEKFPIKSLSKRVHAQDEGSAKESEALPEVVCEDGMEAFRQIECSAYDGDSMHVKYLERSARRRQMEHEVERSRSIIECQEQEMKAWRQIVGSAYDGDSMQLKFLERSARRRRLEHEDEHLKSVQVVVLASQLRANLVDEDELSKDKADGSREFTLQERELEEQQPRMHRSVTAPTSRERRLEENLAVSQEWDYESSLLGKKLSQIRESGEVQPLNRTTSSPAELGRSRQNGSFSLSFKKNSGAQPLILRRDSASGQLARSLSNMAREVLSSVSFYTGTETQPCCICYGNFVEHEIHVLQECGRQSHGACIECLTMHFEIRIREARVKDLCCPSFGSDDCKSHATETELHKLLKAELMAKYRGFVAQQADPSLRDCPKCGTKCRPLQVPGKIEIKAEMTCSTCGEGFCFYHSNAHAPGRDACVEYDRKMLKEERLTRAKLGTKDCPQCGQLTQKSSGCNHMSCRCGCEWCWLCGRSLDKGVGLGWHYNPVNPLGCPQFQDPVAQGDHQRLMLLPVARIFGVPGAIVAVIISIIGLVSAVLMACVFGLIFGALIEACVLCCIMRWGELAPKSGKPCFLSVSVGFFAVGGSFLFVLAVWNLAWLVISAPFFLLLMPCGARSEHFWIISGSPFAIIVAILECFNPGEEDLPARLNIV